MSPKANIITKFGEYINQSWKHASLVALVFAIVPLLGWVSVVIMALITLRKGAQQGLIVLLVASIPSIVLLYLGVNVPWVIIMLLGNILTWVLAIVLRNQVLWSSVLTTCIVSTVLVAFTLRLVFPNLDAVWYSILHVLYIQANKDASIFWQIPANIDLNTYVRTMSRLITPVLILVQVVLSVTNLLIARWWQASLFNPGGFGKEISQIRLGYVVLGFALIVLAAIFFGIKAGWDVLPTIIAAFFFVGIVVFHQIVKQKKSKVAWLWLFYGLLVLLFPYSLLIVAGLGITDAFIDFRARQAQ